MGESGSGVSATESERSAVQRPDEIRTCHVCINVSCEAYGSREVLAGLTAGLEGTDVAVKTIVCFGACELAPNVLLHPKGLWYSHVDVSDVPDIVASIRGGPPVERLRHKIEPNLFDLIMGLIDAGIE